MMMMITSPDTDTPTYETISDQQHINTTTTYPSWKLYENPFYNSSQHHQNPPHHQHQHYHHHQCQSNKPNFHHLHLRHSTRKIAASFWDLSFFRNIMETDMDIARAQIIELKAELDYERKARKRAEYVSKRLAKELAEERRGREAMERVCEELAREISSEKVEIDRVKREMDEERKMLRIAEVLREERVQMKLTEAKILFEEKLLELEETKRTQMDSSISKNMENRHQEDHRVPGLSTASSSSSSLSGKFARLILSEKSIDDNNGDKLQYNDNVGNISSTSIQRRALSEPENPHIKRGIKGFVEFPRVVRAIGSKSRHWGTKLECQKAQLRILLKQKSPIRSDNLIMS